MRLTMCPACRGDRCVTNDVTGEETLCRVCAGRGTILTPNDATHHFIRAAIINEILEDAGID